MSRVILSGKDRQVLTFLWRFKFAPTSVIAARYFSEATQWAVYQRLLRLARGGFIQSLYPDCGRHHFWRLDDKGYEIVQNNLPELVQIGHGSENIRHDYLVMMAHLGSWLKAQPKSVRLFTEQELRRISPSNYPVGVPKATGHRPDGYWIIENGIKHYLVGLEVELSQKAMDIYESVARFYYEDAFISQVLWIVRSKDQGRRMIERFNKVVFEGAEVHSFILLSDFLKLHWQSKIVIGKDFGQTMQTTLETMTRTRQEYVLDFDFSDTRKNPKDSKLNKKREPLFAVN